MSKRISNAILLSGMFIFTLTAPIWGQSGADSTHSPTASLEARIARDSAGCPVAVEVWLLTTTDTIQGFEVVLMWDRPGLVQFRRGIPTEKNSKPVDSITALLRPADPKVLIPVTRSGSLLSTWELVEARSTNGLSAKIIAVAKLFGQGEVAPILPGSSGALLSLPIDLVGSEAAGQHPDTASVAFDLVGTRLSTQQGALFAPPRVAQALITFPACKM